MTSPAPYVLTGQWFTCRLKGGQPRARLLDVSVVPARPVPFEPDMSQLDKDPHRNERVVHVVLRSHLMNTASRFPQPPACTLRDWKPRQAIFSEKGTVEIQVLCDGIGGPVEVKAHDEMDKDTYSLPFAVCTDRIVISSSLQDWERQLEPQGGWPLSWLKDMGKKDKTLSFTVAAGNKAPTTPMPLRCRLAYHDGLFVPNQKLLTLKATPEISEKKSSFTIHFRIEDVSKNHQSKSFIVVVESSRDSDWAIGPAAIFPVTVKSKINKKRRRDDDEGRSSKRQESRHNPPPIPPELLTALSSSLAHDLSRNSMDRAQIDAELRELFEQSKSIHEKTKTALERLTKLSDQRHSLESQFSDLIARCGFKPPESDMPGTGLNTTTSSAAAGMPNSSSAVGINNMMALSQQSLSAVPMNSIGSLGGGLGHLHQELALGHSTSSALVFGGDEGHGEHSSAMFLPSGNLLRLSTGELFSLSVNVGNVMPSHSLSSVDALARRMSSAPPSANVGMSTRNNSSSNRGSEASDSDEDNDADAGPPPCAFIRSTPVVMGSGERRWLAFSESLKLLGFFLDDAAFVEVSPRMDKRWIVKQELDVKQEMLKRVSDESSLIDQVVEIMRNASST